MTDILAPHMQPERSFQGMILALQKYWADYGCAVLQPYDMEVGAVHLPSGDHAACARSASMARGLCASPPAVPTDGRYGENPNRLQHYYQFQVLLKPSPKDLQDLYLGSLKAIGIDSSVHDIRFVEDDWESPTLGAWGLVGNAGVMAWKCPSSPISSRVCGIECAPVAGELTYGLERLAMYVQGVDNVYDLNYNGREGAEKISYGDVFLQAEQEYSRHNFEYANTEMLFRHFKDAEEECRSLLKQGAGDDLHLCVMPAYDQCIKASTSSTCSMPVA